MAAETWNERELPILEAIAALEEELIRRHDLTDDLLQERTGLDGRTVERALRSLEYAGYLTGTDASSMSGFGMMSIELRGPGRRAIGQWPSTDPADAFVRALDRMLATEADPDERSRLQRLRDAAADVTKQVLSGALVVAGETLMR